ncbi:hypothetical protein FRC06_005529, partial [Ceratobasidium sp. 370]
MDLDIGNRDDISEVADHADVEGKAEASKDVGADTLDIYNDNSRSSAYDDTMSDTSSSHHDWYDIGTPPPTPPRSPFQLSDNDDPSEDEDGYQHVTAEDYREYDRWFAEDSQAEFDEMIAETLTEEELDSIKMMAIRQFGHISQRGYERIRFSFREKLRFLTLQRL